VRTYVCDNCGKIFPALQHEDTANLFSFTVKAEVSEWSGKSLSRKIGEYCHDCMVKIEAKIKAGVN
jgi:hypothetical protein